MDKKNLIGLAAVLAVLVALSLVQKRSRTSSRPAVSAPGAVLLEGVDLNAVSKVTVSQGSNSVEMAKQDGAWVVASRYNYPADFSKLAQGLRELAAVKSGQPVRSGNVDPAEYGLDDSARMIVLSGETDTLASLEVGARREASRTAGWANQHFVRSGGSAAVLLVDRDFRTFSENPEDWIDRTLLDVKSEDIVSVKVADAELKTDGGEWTLAGLDKENEELQTAEAGKLRRALGYLNCTAVADPAKSDEELGFADPEEYKAVTSSTNSYTVQIGGEAEGGRYVRIASSDEAVNSKFSGWTYVISNYDADDMLLTREKLVKTKEKPEAEETPTEPAE